MDLSKIKRGTDYGGRTNPPQSPFSKGGKREERKKKEV